MAEEGPPASLGRSRPRPERWGGRVAYVRDPAGNLLELFEAIPMTQSA